MLELLAALELIESIAKRLHEVLLATVKHRIDQNALLAPRRGGHRFLLWIIG
jgi:hypothetical protein